MVVKFDYHRCFRQLYLNLSTILLLTMVLKFKSPLPFDNGIKI